MACLIRKRGKFYRKIRLDLWGYYAMYGREHASEGRKVNHTLLFWANVKTTWWKYKKYMRGRYVFRLWNRPRLKGKRRLKSNFIKPRYLRSFYMVLKRKTYIKYIKRAMKGKLVRGFVSTYLGFLEGRLFIVVYRLNLINNIFMVKLFINLGIFFINFKKKTHINTKVKLGDLIHIGSNWEYIFKKDMILRLGKGMILKNIRNFYSNFVQFYFFFFKMYKIDDITYPIRIDLYRAIDFIGPLR